MKRRNSPHIVSARALSTRSFTMTVLVGLSFSCPVISVAAAAKDVPRLSIRQEKPLQISGDSLVVKAPDLSSTAAASIAAAVVTQFKASNVVDSKKGKDKVGTVTTPPNLFDPSHPAVIPAFSAPAPVEDAKLASPDLKQKEVRDFSDDEFKLAEGLIFLDIQKNGAMALGLFADLEKNSKLDHVDLRYHLGRASEALGLHGDFRAMMKSTIQNKDENWQKLGALQLIEYATADDQDLVPLVDPIVQKKDLELKGNDRYLLNLAKQSLDQQDLGQALSSVALIEKESKIFHEAQFLKSLLLYRSGDIAGAIQTLTSAKETLDLSLDRHKELKSLMSLTLARLQFQTGDYKQSFQSYLGVDKAYSQWPQAMVEQAWAQILSGDNEGAAGNMFSLHTDFFKNTFAPESYVVRAVSYLNLCQFSDGAHVVYDLRSKYSKSLTQLQEYQTRQKNPIDTYETVKKFLKDATSKEIDGLSRGLIWSLARHAPFTEVQQMINARESEHAKLDQVILDLIQREKYLLAEQGKLHEQIAKLSANTTFDSHSVEITNLDKKIASYKIQYALMKGARAAIKDWKTANQERYETERQQNRQLAGKILTKRVASMRENLEHSFDQTEILQYEIFSGAGEHLRLQAAGGKIDPKSAEGLTPEEKKQLKWEFKGELWEDEIGHYRSSLKNVCGQLSGTETK